MTFKKDSKDGVEKPLMSAIVPEFMLAMGDRLQMGFKYGYENWKQCKPEELFHIEGALLRHACQARFDDSEDHLAAVAINAMFLWWFKNKTNKLQ